MCAVIGLLSLALMLAGAIGLVSPRLVRVESRWRALGVFVAGFLLSGAVIASGCGGPPPI